MRDPTVRGWVAVALLTIVVFLTWSPSIGAALGDNHEGRILGRHAIHVENAHRHGVTSPWLSDLRPYALETVYANHPPLLIFGYYATDMILPTRTDTAMRVFAYLGGVAALPVGAALLRRLGFSWPAVLLPLAAMAVTPLFWAYGRLTANVTLVLAMILMIVRLREDRVIGPGELVATCLLAVMAIVAGYLGLAAAALLGLWLFARRRLDRVTVLVGVAMVVGAAIAIGYVVGVSGAADVAEQIEFRTAGGEFTAAEWWERIQRWFRELLPRWWRWLLMPSALVAGLLHPRTRVLTVITTLVTIGWIAGLPNGSFIHDYWIFPSLLPVVLGTAALTSWLTRLLDGQPVALRAGVAAGAVLFVVAAAVRLGTGPVPERYFEQPELAGELVRDTRPPDGQERAWHLRAIPTPRWYSLYWQLPARPIGGPGEDLPLTLTDVPDDDLVLARLDRLPGWLPERAVVEPLAVAARGHYALLSGDVLRDLAAAP